MTNHTAWADLPAAVRAAVTAHTGPVAAAHDIPDGLNCLHASALDTPGGTVFLKAAEAADAAALHDREQATAPLVHGIGPALRWRTHAGGWDLIAFDAIPGARHAHLTPGTTDLPAIADLLTAASTLTAPDGLPDYAGQYADHATPAELAQLHGTTLVHGDINPHNMLIADGRAWLVDWAGPSRGPAWADTAEAAIRLIEDGHTAADAHSWATQTPAWIAADPAAVATWAELRCRAWTARIGAHAARHSNQRHRALADELRVPLR